MCLVGDTLLPLADGQDHSLDTLAAGGGEVLVYACTPSGRIVFAAARVTRRCGTKLASCVGLDNDLSVTGVETELMSRNGVFEKVANIGPGASLMPLYRKRDKDGYVLVQQNYSGRWQKAHWIIARCGLIGPIPTFPGQRTVIHHKNFDATDNRPLNLEFMGDRDHSAYHRSLVQRNKHWHSDDFEARRVEALARKANTAEGHAYFAERGRRNLLNYMAERPDEFRAAVAGNGRRGAPVLSKYNSSEKGRAKSKERANMLYECERCGAKVKSYIGLHNHRRWKHGYNHKVTRVEPASETRELFCVAVLGHDNFAMSAGVFVRSCRTPT